MSQAIIDEKLDELAVNTIKFLAVDGVEKAKSGHPGLPMGAADYAYIRWTKYLRFNPYDPRWPNRDRFVLSGGHGAMLGCSGAETGCAPASGSLSRVRQSSAA